MTKPFTTFKTISVRSILLDSPCRLFVHLRKSSRSAGEYSDHLRAHQTVYLFFTSIFSIRPFIQIAVSTVEWSLDHDSSTFRRVSRTGEGFRVANLYRVRVENHKFRVNIQIWIFFRNRSYCVSSVYCRIYFPRTWSSCGIRWFWALILGALSLLSKIIIFGHFEWILFIYKNNMRICSIMIEKVSKRSLCNNLIRNKLHGDTQND